jgi:hypothetical protein
MEYNTRSWEPEKRLDVIVALLGYNSFEELEACPADATTGFIFDQDLPADIERERRWLEMAINLAELMPAQRSAFR